MDRLHLGEKEAILLSLNLDADLIILDEKHAREIAQQKGLNVTGLLGILDEASKRGLIDIKNAIDKLIKTTFRINPYILKKLIELFQARIPRL